MACTSCGAGFHEECEEEPCCCFQNESSEEEIEIEEEEEFGNWRLGSRRDATLKDQQSTGRKRAALLFPLNRDEPCEWRNLKSAGGGKYPIVGCRSGLQQARHHGPDKNTLNNDEGNVHRICHTCHNRWHARNDSEYVSGEIPHQHDKKTLAAPEDWLNSELYFSRNKPQKVKAD